MTMNIFDANWATGNPGGVQNHEAAASYASLAKGLENDVAKSIPSVAWFSQPKNLGSHMSAVTAAAAAANAAADSAVATAASVAGAAAVQAGVHGACHPWDLALG